MNRFNCINYQYVVLILFTSYRHSRGDELEPMPMAKKPIPLIINKSQNSEQATTDQAITDQRQMTEGTTVASNDEDYETDQENEQPLQLNWLPPPPPPPSMALTSAESFESMLQHENAHLIGGQRLHGLSHRHHKEEFTLFLVILTIAGFFGLIISMFMPFTLLLSQGNNMGFGGINGLQPAIVPATALGGFPGSTTVGVGGMGRKKRRRSIGESLTAIKSLHQTFHYLREKIDAKIMS